MLVNFLRLVLAVSMLVAGTVRAQAPDRVVFATDWLAQAEHGGFYQALAEGIYKKYGLDVTIKMGGPQVNGLQLLAAGQLDIVMGDALQVISAVEQNVPGHGDRGDVPEESDGDHRASGRREARRTSRDKPIAIGAASNTTFWPWLKQRYGFTDDAEATLRVQRAALSRRQGAVAAGLRHVRAVLDREGRREAGRVPAGRPRLSAVFRGARRDAARRSTSAPMRSTRFVRASAEGWKSYLANPAPGNALIKRDNPEMSDELLAYSHRKMKEYAIVTGGDAATLGLLTMTDARWGRTIDFLRSTRRSTKPGSTTRRRTRSAIVKDVKVLP